MGRINILASVHDPEEARGVVGWFEHGKIQGRWSDTDHDGNGSRGTGRGTAIILTGTGKWVHEDWTHWQGEADVYTYTTAEYAREWLIRNDEDAAITEHFGALPEEEDRRPGRPEIGGRITTALGDELLAKVDDWAELRAMSRAEAVRRLVEHGLRAGTSGFRPRDRVRFAVDGEERPGWYVSQFGFNVSTVTLQAPEDWDIRSDGKAMPPVYTRGDDEIVPAVASA